MSRILVPFSNPKRKFRLKFLAAVVLMGMSLWPLPSSASLAGQSLHRRASSVPDLFNQEAAASDPAGIHKYSEDLIGLIVFNPAGDDSVRQLANRLADRLARAEQAARAGGGKLVPETAVAKAFNHLMQGIGAPPSMRTNEASVHEFREHAASIKAFPALFSADRNGTNCNPGEAVFLLYILISNDGVFYEKNLDAALMEMSVQPRAQPGNPQSEGGGGSAFRIERGPDSWRLLSSYPLHHNHRATFALFDQMADLLGF